MNLENSNILIASGFAAPYGGNFILMLKALAKELVIKYNSRVFFLFPKQEDSLWQQQLKEEYTVFYTNGAYKEIRNQLIEIINRFNIHLVHTHFEYYDIVVAKAIHYCKKDVKMIWHLHDNLTLNVKYPSPTWLNKLKRHLRFWLQYGFWGRNAFFIGVSAEVTHFATHYRKNIFSFPSFFLEKDYKRKYYPYAEVVINGIDTNRIKNYIKKKNKNIPCFISFGGDAYRKGISTIFDAAKILQNDNLEFKIIVSKGYTLPELLETYFGDIRPEWLKVVEQTDDISSLFNECDAYISAAFAETMSMGIAEASIFGLPIIQSNIPGTLWNSDTPSSYLFKVGDPVSLAEQMKNVLNIDKELLERQCKISSQMNRERLDMKLWCENIIRIYKKI